MPIIDFKEIPQANQGSGLQDTFELFCRDFLQCMGYEIIQHPSRGADGGKDMIVSETLTGIIHSEPVNWLVSCKHTAYSGKSISAKDEADLSDRIKSFNCIGYIGMYSVIASAGLSEKLHRMSKEYKFILFDCKKIEYEMIHNPKMAPLFRQYFPKSYKEYQSQNPLHQPTNNSKLPVQVSEDFFRSIKAAVIVVEIEKIIHKYDKRDWKQVENAISEMYAFCNNNSPEVSMAVIEYLYRISNWTRSEMPLNIASGINDLASTYLAVPNGHEITENEIFLLQRCIDAGFNLAYYSFRYLNRLKIACEGLLLVKYSFTICKQFKLEQLLAKINAEYRMIKDSIAESHWSVSEKSIADELLLTFRDDLKTSSLKMPVLSNELYKIYSQEPDN
jgi:hypothetical protein